MKQIMKRIHKCNKHLVKFLLKLEKKLNLKKYQAVLSYDITDSGKVDLRYNIDIPVGKVKVPGVILYEDTKKG